MAELFLWQVLMAKVLEQGPVMVLGFRAQQLTRKLKGDGSVDDVSFVLSSLRLIFYH